MFSFSFTLGELLSILVSFVIGFLLGVISDMDKNN